MFDGCDWNHDGGPHNRRLRTPWGLGKFRQYNMWMLQNGDYSMNMVMDYEMMDYLPKLYRCVTIIDPSENFWSKQLWV